MTAEIPSLILENFAEDLIHWFAKNGRKLPFRESKEPYKVWISEIVFQQTRISQGMSHFQNFIIKFPNVSALAAASEDEVMLAWKGLGYYSRALNVRKAAQQIMQDFKGKFPKTYSEILTLKGIGPYTAAAISSICFEEKHAAVDGNVYRVLSRVLALEKDITSSDALKYFKNIAETLMKNVSPGDFNEAVMDVGSEICTPKNPKCTECPFVNYCVAYRERTITNFPVKAKKVKVENLELKYDFIFWKDSFLIKRRDDKGIWKNLYEFSEHSSFLENTEVSIVTLKHKLTHRNLLIHIYIKEVKKETLERVSNEEAYNICKAEEIQEYSFPKPLQSFLEEFYEVGKESTHIKSLFLPNV